MSPLQYVNAVYHQTWFLFNLCLQARKKQRQLLQLLQRRKTRKRQLQPKKLPQRRNQLKRNQPPLSAQLPMLKLLQPKNRPRLQKVFLSFAMHVACPHVDGLRNNKTRPLCDSAAKPAEKKPAAAAAATKKPAAAKKPAAKKPAAGKTVVAKPKAKTALKVKKPIAKKTTKTGTSAAKPKVVKKVTKAGVAAKAKKAVAATDRARKVQKKVRVGYAHGRQCVVRLLERIEPSDHECEYYD